MISIIDTSKTFQTCIMWSMSFNFDSILNVKIVLLACKILEMTLIGKFYEWN